MPSLELLLPEPSELSPLPEFAPLLLQLLLLPLVPLLGRPLSLPVLMLASLPLLKLLSTPLALPLLLSPRSLLFKPRSLSLLLLISGTVPSSVAVLVTRPLSLPVSRLLSLLLMTGLLFIPVCTSKWWSTVRGLPAAGGEAGRGKKNRLAE
jgi:hypothetical protein